MFSGTTLRGGMFSGATLRGTTLRGAVLTFGLGCSVVKCRIEFML
ncbi:MAG TPA: pentapeptide repeat-containing protein [Candidatus Anaerobiospirillum stercoravium]|nr:pentapeptide repeat-containing protein [Candidatus Anaerobiospirillum stercoravium]